MISVATVGGIRADMLPGSLVIPDQIIDYTHSRKGTFFEGSEMPVIHVDFTEPYTPALRARLLAAAGRCGEAVIDGGTYACTQGPRLETAARSSAHRARDGGDLVGMTGMPETALAREAELAYVRRWRSSQSMPPVVATASTRSSWRNSKRGDARR